MLVFIPINHDLLTRLLADGLADVAGFAATPGLYEGLALERDMEDDAEFGALTFASVASLVRDERRAVAVADVGVTTLTDLGGDWGEVRAARVAPSDVRSLFIDEPDAAPLLAAAHAAAAGRSLEEAWDADAVQELLTEADLLWHDVTEAPIVLAALEGQG